MNIIYMHTHDSGRYWSPYGFAVPTPNIMEFARSATLFRHAYCAGPTCSPSRAALLTGVNPHSNGMQGLAHLGWQLNDYDRHICRFLKRNGYHTVLCGIQHEAPDYRMIGYDLILGSQEFDMGDTVNSMEAFDRSNTDAACSFIADRGNSDGKTFFLSMGLFNTHREFPCAKASDGRDADYLAPPLPLYDCGKNRSDMADYCASAQVADECFGKLLKTVSDAGISGDTAVIMTTDHGIAFPKMKCSLYDSGIGVALLIRLPGDAGQIKATDALVSHLDIFPTICAIAGIDAPEWLEGVNLAPLLKGEVKTVRDAIFSEVTYHAAYEPKRCIRTDRYKLIRRFDFHNGIVPANIDDCASKDFLMDNGYGSRTMPRESLFDLWLDPNERENLASCPEYRDIYCDLSARLEEWMIKTGDPLIGCGSRVPKPKKAKVVKLSCQSPRIPDYED